jgi:hypothetical protein
MARRNYGSGSIVVRADANCAETWYGLWRSDGRRVKRALGPKRAARLPRRPRASVRRAELRRRMHEGAVVLGRAERKTVGEAGERYIEHLARVKRHDRTTIQDYRGYLRRDLGTRRRDPQRRHQPRAVPICVGSPREQARADPCLRLAARAKGASPTRDRHRPAPEAGWGRPGSSKAREDPTRPTAYKHGTGRAGRSRAFRPKEDLDAGHAAAGRP